MVLYGSYSSQFRSKVIVEGYHDRAGNRTPFDCVRGITQTTLDSESGEGGLRPGGYGPRGVMSSGGYVGGVVARGVLSRGVWSGDHKRIVHCIYRCRRRTGHQRAALVGSWAGL